MEMTVDHLERTCARLLPGEQVQAVGLFMPYGVLAATGTGTAVGGLAAPGAAGMALSAAAGLASARGFAAATGQPPYTVVAVTPTHVYAFDASTDGGMWATADFPGPRSFLSSTQSPPPRRPTCVPPAIPAPPPHPNLRLS